MTKPHIKLVGNLVNPEFYIENWEVCHDSKLYEDALWLCIALDKWWIKETQNETKK